MPALFLFSKNTSHFPVLKWRSIDETSGSRFLSQKILTAAFFFKSGIKRKIEIDLALRF